MQIVLVIAHNLSIMVSRVKQYLFNKEDKKMNTATKLIETYRARFCEDMEMGGYEINHSVSDNEEMHDSLNYDCTGFDTIQCQDTWIFSDGSYITRNEDLYWTGTDVDCFENEAN